MFYPYGKIRKVFFWLSTEDDQVEEISLGEELKEIFEYYCKKDKKISQDDLVAMLREIQEVCGGVITSGALQQVCEKLDVKESYIHTVIKFVSDLKTEKVLHRLSICGGVNCKSRNSSGLNDHIKKNYKVAPGGVCEKYSFSYEVCGCMKHCAHGPNVKWDGKVYSEMTPERIDRLIQKQTRNT